MDTKLIEKDARHPVTVAFAHAIRQNLANAKKVESWKQEMELLVEEITKKFVSFFAKGSVRKGLDLVLGILSLPVAHATKGSYDPLAWTKCLLEHGPKGLAKLAIKMVQEMSKKALRPSLTPDSETRKPEYLLLKFAKEEKRDKDRWEGYVSFLHHLELQKEAILSIKKLHWLSVNVAGVDPARLVPLISSTMARLEKNKDDILPEPNQLINAMLYCVCVGKKIPKNLALRGSDIQYHRKAYGKKPSQWLAKAHKRYEALKVSVPDELQTMFLCPTGEDWFEVHMSREGPVRTTRERSADGMNMSHVNAKTNYFLVIE